MNEPNAVAKVIGILSDAFDCPVSSEMPSDGVRPQFINVSLVADESTEFLSLPTIELLVWAGSDAEASSMCLDCFDALCAAAETDDYLSSVAMNTMSRDTWANTGHARYRLDVDLTINK